MTQVLARPPLFRPDETVISMQSWCSNGEDLIGSLAPVYASATWPSANLAIYMPFEIKTYFTVKKLWWANGTTVGTNNVDIGIYSEALARLVNGGGTLSAVANDLQSVDIADIEIAPGRYLLGMSCNGTTATFLRTAQTAVILRSQGVAQQATAYTLPSTAVPAVMAQAFLPLCGITGRTLV